MTIDIEESVEAFIENRINDINTCLPGKVERVDMALMQVDVRPLMAKKYINGYVLPPPLLRNVPISMPRTNNSIFYIPINENDQVTLFFAQRDITEFIYSKDEWDVYFPASRRKYDLNDAIAMPGLYSFNSEIANEPLDVALQNRFDTHIIHFDNVFRLSTDDGIEIKTTTTTITIDNNGLVTIDGDVQLNGDLNVSGDITANGVNANGVDLDDHVHTGVEPGAGNSGGPV